jgi:hypothetical protein
VPRWDGSDTTRVRSFGSEAFADENGRFVAVTAWMRERGFGLSVSRRGHRKWRRAGTCRSPEYLAGFIMSEAAVEILSDRDLLRAYQRSGSDGDEALTRILLREIERRGLDIWLARDRVRVPVTIMV